MAAILGLSVHKVSKPKTDFDTLSLYEKSEVPNLSTWVQSVISGTECCGR